MVRLSLTTACVALAACLACRPITLAGPRPAADCPPRPEELSTATVPTISPSGATGVAVVAATRVVVAGQIPSTATPVPREELVRRAVVEATQTAQQPTPTPVPPGCSTPVSVPPSDPNIADLGARPPTPLPAARLAASAVSTPELPRPLGVITSPTVVIWADLWTLVRLHVGEQFVLILGNYTGMDWTVRVGDDRILRRVGSQGQGQYQVIGPGETTLEAEGQPTCARAADPCARRGRLFQIRVEAT